MTRYWVSIAALLAGCWLPNLAMGSCISIEMAGFIHAKATRLPSNARGALFLPPHQRRFAIAYKPDGTYVFGIAPPPLLPSDFTVTSDAEAGFLPVEIVALDLPRGADSVPAKRVLRFASTEAQALFEKDRAALDLEAMIKAGTLVDISDTIRSAGLVRVGPVGGFKPGVHYTITYTGEREGGWDYPARVEHTTDAAALRADGATYRLALDGLAERQMLKTDPSSEPGGIQAATVQNFHYVVPESHKPYQDALLYFSESRGEPADARRPGGFTNLHHRSTACERSGFGEAALGPGRELISAPCGPNAGRASIRGWVGMLEVEDHLRPTAPVLVDFNKTNGGSCNAHGMLKQAVESGDGRRIEDAVCAASSLYWVAPQAGEVPVMADLFTLASSGSERARTCTRDVLAGLLIRVPAQRAAFLGSYAELIGVDLASSDSDVARHARRNLNALQHVLSDEDAQHPELAPSLQKLLEPVLPVLLGAIVSGTPAQSRSAGDTITWLGKGAMPLLPALLAAAELTGDRAANAAHALVALIPHDLRLHRVLLRHAANPALLETAALDYNRVAGNLDPVKAIGLLSDAARRGSSSAILALSEHGLAARASVPTLIAILKEGGGNAWQAYNALFKVSDGGPEVLAAFANSINAAPGKQFHSSELDKLAKFKEQGQAFLPAIALRMQRPMGKRRQASLKTIIESMALPPPQQSEWLARLAKATLDNDPY